VDELADERGADFAHDGEKAQTQVVRGQVLAENSTMIAMCKELGFHVADDPSDRNIKVVTLSLAEVPANAID
jgi:hypothetical protein